MKRTFVFLLLLAMAAPLAAEEATQTGQQIIQGEINNLNTSRSLVVVKRPVAGTSKSYEQIECYLDDESRIIKNGQDAAFRKLFPGDKVRIELKAGRTSGQNVASLVEVTE